jgi:hypothetical protein
MKCRNNKKELHSFCNKIYIKSKQRERKVYFLCIQYVLCHVYEEEKKMWTKLAPQWFDYNQCCTKKSYNWHEQDTTNKSCDWHEQNSTNIFQKSCKQKNNKQVS